MGVLNGNQIKKLVGEGGLIIDPFDERMIQPASYDLRLGPEILASPLGPNALGEEVTLGSSNPTYAIQTGQMVAVMSKEHIELPLDICSNSFGIRSEFVKKGLLCFGGPHLDPGWKGHLIVTLQNIGPEPMVLTVDQPFFTVTFDQLDEPVEPGNAYSGSHQDQDGFPEDQVDYILTARITSLAEIPSLRDNFAILAAEIPSLRENAATLAAEFEKIREDFKATGNEAITSASATRSAEISSLLENVVDLSELVELLNNQLPDPDADLELSEEFLERLNRSLDSASESLLSAEQMREHLSL